MNRLPTILGTAMTVAVTSAVLAACGTGATPSSSPTSPNGPTARVFTPPSPAAVPQAATTPARPQARGAAQTARAFAAAFGVYETGQLAPPALRQLRATATADLVDALWAQPVRGAGDRAAARPTNVLLSATGQPAGQMTATVLRDDGSSLNAQLHRTGSAWTVTAVSPGQPGKPGP